MLHPLLAYAPQMVRAEVSGRLWRALEAAEAASPVDAVAAVSRELGATLGATEVSFLIADLSGRALVRLSHVATDGDGDEEQDEDTDGSGDGDGRQLPNGERRAAREQAEVIPFDGGPGEEAVRTQTVQVLAPGHPALGRTADDQWTVLAPMTQRGEVIGLLELRLPQEPDADSLDEVARLAHVLAFVVIASRRHTDLYEWGQRSRPHSLSAEIQQRLLPGPRTCEAEAFTLSAWLEPAAEIAGDTFDFSLARDLLHLSMTDAMGHGVAAALTASLCVGSLRGARRQGASLMGQASATNEALSVNAVHGAPDNFVTGLLGRVDLPSGTLELVNAGHIPPFLVRRGVVTMVQLPADLPFGMFAETRYHSSELRLEPGDRIVIVTDGMLERNAAGIDLSVAIKDTRDLHPREVVRLLADSVLRATGHELEDDATVMVLDWKGEHGGPRETEQGADSARASSPLTGAQQGGA
ncbi:MAG: PP2C family protein-serine/threonine phosphatase [Nocardioides sp.]